MDFSRKVVLVTGASSGIGEATALLLSELGAQLVLVARNAEGLHRVARECHFPRDNVPLVVTADVTEEKDVKRIESEVISHFGKLDVLLNIVGGIIPESILQPDVERFDRNINLNLRSVYMMMAHFTPHLQETKGNIVNVTSTDSDILLKGHCGFNVSKAGLEYLTKYAAAELVHVGIRVNCVKPGTTRTRILENASFAKHEADNMFDELQKKMPLGNIIEPREVAQTIGFLASELAKNVTGSCYTVDGGQTLVGPSAIQLN